MSIRMNTVPLITACVTGGVLLMGGIVVATTPQIWTSDSDTTSARSTTPTVDTFDVDQADTGDVEAMREQAYINVLDSGGIDYSSRDAAIQTGRVNCAALDGGVSLETAQSVLTQGGVLTDGVLYDAGEAGYIMGASAAAFCPQHLPQ